MRKRVLNWNHQPVKPYTLALARESGGMADAISASERPDCCCSFTTLQSTWSVDIELHPEIPPARSNVPSAAAIPSLRKASAMKYPLRGRIHPVPNASMLTILLCGSILQAEELRTRRRA